MLDSSPNEDARALLLEQVQRIQSVTLMPKEKMRSREEFALRFCRPSLSLGAYQDKQEKEKLKALRLLLMLFLYARHPLVKGFF